MSEHKSERERRLAQALRANLRRRKGQARERDETESEAGEPGGDTPRVTD